MRIYGLGPDDLWDETVTALLRAAIHYDPAAGTTFRHYAQRAVNRACWRYLVRDHLRRTRHGTRVALEDVVASAELMAPSAEAEAIARDAARRAWLLREHAATAAARDDEDTTSRLRAAASATDRVATRSRRRASPSSGSA
jgi:hypothetical protein